MCSLDGCKLKNKFSLPVTCQINGNSEENTDVNIKGIIKRAVFVMQS